MGDLLSNFGNLISNNVYFALVISFLAGIVASFSPCVLSTLPLIVGYVGEAGVKDKKTAFKYSLLFSIGLILTFTTLGIVFSVIGKFMNLSGKWWYIILGLILLLAGLKLIGVLGDGAEKSCKVPSKRRGFLGAFLLGIVGGALSSPCSTPVLAAILAFVAQKGNILVGVLMLLLYSMGHSLLILLAGTSVGLVEQLSISNKTRTLGRTLKLTLGIVVIFLGLYLLYLGF